MTVRLRAFRFFGAAAVRVPGDNPRAVAVRSSVRRSLDVLAVIFLVDVILIWSFPDGPAAFLHALDVIAWIVWACFAVDYRAAAAVRRQGQFVRTHLLDLLMVVLPMLRLLRIFLLLRRSLASVSTETIAGSIVSLVVAAVFVSAFLMWRVEHTPRRHHHHLPLCVVVGDRHHHHGGLRRLHAGHRDGRIIARPP